MLSFFGQAVVVMGWLTLHALVSCFLKQAGWGLLVSADGSIPRLERIQIIVVVPLEILKDLELSHLLLPCKSFHASKTSS